MDKPIFVKLTTPGRKEYKGERGTIPGIEESPLLLNIADIESVRATFDRYSKNVTTVTMRSGRQHDVTESVTSVHVQIGIAC